MATAKELMLNQLNKEFIKVTEYADLLIIVRRNLMNPKYEYEFKDLLVRFDIITDKLNLLYVLINEFNSDEDSLENCVECLNIISFNIMNFIVDVMQYKNILKPL